MAYVGLALELLRRAMRNAKHGNQNEAAWLVEHAEWFDLLMPSQATQAQAMLKNTLRIAARRYRWFKDML